MDTDSFAGKYASPPPRPPFVGKITVAANTAYSAITLHARLLKISIAESRKVVRSATTARGDWTTNR